MSTSPEGRASLPPEGRRIAFVGKGGSGKSTIIAYLLGHWAEDGYPVAALDADEPGDEENGSLTEWADLVEMAGPVYPAPSRSHLRQRAKQLTPAGGLLAIDTGAWIRRAGNTHFTVLSTADLVVMTMAPTAMELDRAGSVLAALDHLTDVGAHCPRLVICLTMVNASAASGDETAGTLRSAGYHVLTTRVPRSDAREGYGQAFGRVPRLVPDSPMDRLAAEVAAEAAQ
ncbi:ParA family protein [Streptomyces sp. TR06-5]|uniref:ParA family protein n=1 Tax=Streptomyces sp. TR06-5 TaxID=3385976 RepID=UPI0039A1DEE4